MTFEEHNFTLVLAMRPDMTDADARWAAKLLTDLAVVKNRERELRRTLDNVRNWFVEEVSGGPGDVSEVEWKRLEKILEPICDQGGPKQCSASQK
jgi:hypothetical protein